MKSLNKKPMQMVELSLNMMIAKTPNLINCLDRSNNHLITRKQSNVPLSAQ